MNIEKMANTFDTLGITYNPLTDDQVQKVKLVWKEMEQTYRITLNKNLKNFYINFGLPKLNDIERVVVSCLEENPVSRERKVAEVCSFLNLEKEEDSIYNYLDDYSGRMPKGVFPICESYYGDFICSDKKGGIYYWFHEFDVEEALTLIAKDIEQFVYQLYLEKEETLSELDSIEGVLSWEPSEKMKELLQKSGIKRRE